MSDLILMRIAHMLEEFPQELSITETITYNKKIMKFCRSDCRFCNPRLKEMCVRFFTENIPYLYNNDIDNFKEQYPEFFI